MILNWFDLSGLDYCNSLFAGVTNCVISRMQLIQDAAAHSLLGTQLFQHSIYFLFKISLLASGEILCQHQSPATSTGYVGC